MAHGTGYYMERIYKADIETEEYAVIFCEERHYYHEQMSDCYEPTWEKTGKYEVTVMAWRKNRWGNQVADCLSQNIQTGEIDKETANKIWWNLKNRNMNFETVKQNFIKLAGREITM